MTIRYSLLSDQELTDAGWNPTLFSDADPNDGPYRAARFPGNCPCCGSGVSGWSVVNIETGVGSSQEYYSDNAQTDAEEEAGKLNYTWLRGYNAALGITQI